MGIHRCLLILEPSRDAAANANKLGERSEDASPLSPTIDCGKGRKALILSSKIPWNQKVAILLSVSFSGAIRRRWCYIERHSTKRVLRYVPATNRGHVSSPDLL